MDGTQRKGHQASRDWELPASAFGSSTGIYFYRWTGLDRTYLFTPLEEPEVLSTWGKCFQTTMWYQSFLFGEELNQHVLTLSQKALQLESCFSVANNRLHSMLKGSSSTWEETSEEIFKNNYKGKYLFSLHPSKTFPKKPQFLPCEANSACLLCKVYGSRLWASVGCLKKKINGNCLWLSFNQKSSCEKYLKSFEDYEIYLLVRTL